MCLFKSGVLTSHSSFGKIQIQCGIALFSDWLCIFAEYDPFKTTIIIQHFIKIDFCINLTQFYINFSRQEHQIELPWVSINS